MVDPQPTLSKGVAGLGPTVAGPVLTGLTVGIVVGAVSIMDSSWRVTAVAVAVALCSYAIMVSWAVYYRRIAGRAFRSWTRARKESRRAADAIASAADIRAEHGRMKLAHAKADLLQQNGASFSVVLNPLTASEHDVQGQMTLRNCGISPVEVREIKAVSLKLGPSEAVRPVTVALVGLSDTVFSMVFAPGDVLTAIVTAPPVGFERRRYVWDALLAGVTLVLKDGREIRIGEIPGVASWRNEEV